MSSSNSSLCEHCQQRPRNGTHPFCTKKCAAQYASLCSYCHKKPKYAPHEFCGKHCAAMAKSNKGAPGIMGMSSAPALPAQSQGAAGLKKILAPVIAGVSNALHPQAQAPAQAQYNAPPQPAYAPSYQYMPPAANPASYNRGPPAPQFNQPAPPQGFAAPPPHPIFTNMQNYQPQVNAPRGSYSTHAKGQYAQGSAPALCRIPGCGQPVHVDVDGLQTSDYCSMKHREDAVNSGLVSPCIMCRDLPQSDKDFFCSRACREDALHKDEMT